MFAITYDTPVHEINYCINRDNNFYKFETNAKKFNTMKKVKIGGVPEHFNFPVIHSIRTGLFKQKGLEVEWINYPAGTGAMCQELRKGNLDLSILLTEGVIADIVKGNSVKLLKEYVSSPLLWGIHVSGNSSIKSVSELTKPVYAISRYGSGSHLMAIVNTLEHRKPIENLRFNVINNLEGARKSLKEGTSQIFMWEKYMTQPYVDNGEFRRIGICPTPWPAFMIAGRINFVEQNEKAVINLLEVINQSVVETKHNQEYTVTAIADFFDLKRESITEWLKKTSWSHSNNISMETLTSVMNTLQKAGIIEEVHAAETLCFNFVEKT